jgi:hypothetical protein
MAIVFAAAWSLFVLLAAYVAGHKGRDPLEGVLFGLLMGPLGLLIVALMPARRPAPSANRGLRIMTAPPKASDAPAAGINVALLVMAGLVVCVAALVVRAVLTLQ